MANMRPMQAALPIDHVLPELIDALRRVGRVVVQAPPGAGKTTRVPLAMLQSGLCAGRIVMLEPRRLAARAAAERMAEALGEPVGQTVGYRMRGAQKRSKSTRIEVVTEGILTRMLQSAPDLPGVSAVIFDEFHERSLNADLGLALCLEVGAALREDLQLVVMSATLEAAPVAALMKAPVVTSRGRRFDVDTHYLAKPLRSGQWAAAPMVDLIQRAEAETRAMGGAMLVFLPGAREIRQVAAALRTKLPEDCVVAPLYGALSFEAQRAALMPATTGRKIVLATSIAETSLTIEGVRVVVDSGLARRARFDPGSGMSRLITERASRAEAEQRRGRAGRISGGHCYRLWTRGQQGGFAAFPPPEIEIADLADLALQLALWGAEPGDLPFLTAPPAGPLAEARRLLVLLGAIDARGWITAHGRALARLPLHPRLGHMLQLAGRGAAALAALLAGPDVLSAGPVDMRRRIALLSDGQGPARPQAPEVNPAALAQARTEFERLRRLAPATAQSYSHAQMAALAYPDRIAQRRRGGPPRYVLSGGKGARMGPEDPLAAAPWLVALDLDGDPREARIRLGIEISLPEIRALFEDRITWQASAVWSRREGRVIARRAERLGALILDDAAWTDAPAAELAAAMLTGVREIGLGLQGAAARFAARCEMARGAAALGAGAADAAASLPDMSHDGLMESLDEWLTPFVGGLRSAAEWKRFDLLAPLEARLDWSARALLDKIAPAHFTTPLGRAVPLDYAAGAPAMSVRLQELFGLAAHPQAAGQAIVITLLSPANRPVQVTRDLPGFWQGSYSDVRKDMRARYPKHPWPENPAQAQPTLRAKPRG